MPLGEKIIHRFKPPFKPEPFDLFAYMLVLPRSDAKILGVVFQIRTILRCRISRIRRGQLRDYDSRPHDSGCAPFSVEEITAEHLIISCKGLHRAVQSNGAEFFKAS